MKKLFILTLVIFSSTQTIDAQIIKDIIKAKDKITGITVDKLSRDPITTSFRDVDKKRHIQDDYGNTQNFTNIFQQEYTAKKGFQLAPGFYEGAFKSFCVKAGTVAPNKGSGRFYSELKGPKKDIIKTILAALHNDSSLKQREVQLLLWAIIAKTDFQKMQGPVKVTALKILSAKEITRLSKGALDGLARKQLNKLTYKSDALRAVINAENNLRVKYYQGARTYAEYEDIAMIAGVEPVVSGWEQGRWIKHPDGYYLRYYPSGYAKTRTQIYVPDSAGTVFFNGSGDIAVPPGSGQRLLQTNLPYGNVGIVETTEDPDKIRCINRVDPTIDKAIKTQMIMQNLPGLVAAVFQNGEIIHMKAYGYSDISKKEKLTTETVMHWASISKTITSTAALQLAEDPNIDYNINDLATDHCAPYWPSSVEYTSTQDNDGIDERPGKITLSHLLQNRSGIQHYGRIETPDGRKKWTTIATDTINFWRSNNDYIPENDLFNARSSVGEFNKSVLGFAPGMGSSYTTFGFNLLGATIDEASPDGYVSWVRRNIANPTGMSSLRVAKVRKPSGLVDIYDSPISGHGMSQDGVLKIIKTTDKESVLPGGGWESNICDLAKFSIHLAQGDFFEQSDDVLWNVPNGQNYKYGIRSKNLGTTNEMAYHGGKHSNLRSFMHFFPSDTTGIVLISPAVYAELSQVARVVYRSIGVRPNLYDVAGNDQTPLDKCRADMGDGNDLFNTIWHKKSNKDNTNLLIRTGLEHKLFYEEVERLRAAGYHCKDFETFREGNTRYWDGVFQKGHAQTKMWRNASKDAFVAKSAEMKNNGYRLLDLETYLGSDGKRYWAGIFRKTNDEYAVRLDRTTAAFAAIRESEQAAGRKLIDVEVYRANGQAMWNGVFSKGRPNKLNRNMTIVEFGLKRIERTRNGYKLIDYEYYKVSGEWKVAAIWEKTRHEEKIRALRTFCEIMDDHTLFSDLGYELVDWERLPGAADD